MTVVVVLLSLIAEVLLRVVSAMVPALIVLMVLILVVLLVWGRRGWYLFGGGATDSHSRYSGCNS